ncbi:Carbamoyl-phosphate synthase small chain [Acaryochloris thomasi RCC1774]|uniref:Carbamoyl-phosphate synthase small chain n=1 Tax=Acaryochloris thomasi RCC1774 TaxID=1764569 RepID=A0A2W1JKE0_9CYAN|nr:type 1 glutamine amidotransferase [Acaryochloris thomasi]PZD71935.1 Carbamoyl-phosphate synthase small chain [Acaryochloris thomasi RCC1774]
MNILVIQSGALDPIGVLGDALIQQGANLSIWLSAEEEAPPEGDYAGLILLGGSMNAHEDEKFPHLHQCVELIHQFHAEGKPIMGVCLGAQLIARAFGRQVYPHTVPEIGFVPITVADPTAEEPWLQGCPDDLHLMQWHFDTFDLPNQATLLMTNDICKHQAYRIGRNIYGFQFHLEVTPEIVRKWLATKNEWVEKNYPDLDQQVAEQLAHYAHQSARFAEQVANFWINLVPVSLSV